METTIYYFSATGNSLSLARNMADKLGNCNLVPIAKTIEKANIKITTPRVGIVFPVFAWGMPRIVEEFVNKLSFSRKPYIFAIATCVAIQGNTLKDLKKALRLNGLDLNAGFAVKAGRSSLMKLNSLDNIIIKLDRHRKQIKSSEARLPEMLATIEKLANHSPETSSWAANIFGSMFHGLAVKTFKNIDSTFIIDGSCTGCGTCVKLCPRSNIVIENGRPVFLHNCELCHACIQWCPGFAIRHPNFDISLSQYRNSAVALSDMVINA